MKSTRRFIVLSGILLALYVGYLLVAHKGPSDATRGARVVRLVPASDDISNRSIGTELPPQFTTKRARLIEKLQDKRPEKELYKNVNQLFGDAEAERATLLSTTRHQTETWYLFGITPPSADEVGKLKRELSEIQRHVPPKQRQSFDDLVGFTIDGYEPFDINGLKGILIMIPDDPQGKIHGTTFSSNGFDEDKERFDPRHPDEHTFDNYQGFHREDGKIPERFESLIKKDSTLAEQAGRGDGGKPSN